MDVQTGTEDRLRYCGKKQRDTGPLVFPRHQFKINNIELLSQGSHFQD
jgi:hypothetical protein